MMSRATRSLLGCAGACGQPEQGQQLPAAPASAPPGAPTPGAAGCERGVARTGTRTGSQSLKAMARQRSRPPDAVHRCEPMPADRAGSVGGRTPWHRPPRTTAATDASSRRRRSAPGHHRAARAPRPDRDHRQGAARTRPGLHLADTGRGQAERVAERIGELDRAAACTARRSSGRARRRRRSPRPSGRRVHVDKGLLECDFGEWTGESARRS